MQPLKNIDKYKEKKERKTALEVLTTSKQKQ